MNRNKHNENNSRMNKTTALTGTTNTTKEKEGSTPWAVLFTFTITLFLVGLIAFHSAGQPIHGGMSLAAAATGGGGGTTRGASKKTTVTPTSIPTLQMFLQQYPEVQDRSSEEQDQLYMVYKLHVSGATSDVLDKFKTKLQ